MRRVVFVVILLALAGCGGDEDKESTKTSPSGADSARAGAEPAAIGRPAGRLLEATVPGSICGATDPIKLHRGEAVVRSNRLPGYRRIGVSAGWKRPASGDLDGDGEDEVALNVGCNNRGGTADGFFAYAAVVFTRVRSPRRVVGVLTPQQRPLPHNLPTLLAVKIEPGQVVAREAWYGRRDGTCCPSGRSVTTWHLVDGELIPGRTVVKQFPKGLRS